MPKRPRPKEESFWILKVPKIGPIKFKCTKHGRLGVKTTTKPKIEKQKQYICPNCNKELVDTFRGKFCTVDNKYFLESEAIVQVRSTKTGKEYTWDQFKKMHPRTKEANAIAIVDSNKVNYSITDTTSSYFLVPINEYENILKYNQLVYLLKENNLTVITSPITLLEGSETSHVFAIFADLNRSGLIAVQLLKKEGLREIPAGGTFTEQVESPQQVIATKEKLLKKSFSF